MVIFRSHKINPSNKNTDIKKIISPQVIAQKKHVDLNILLNRVRIEKKNDIKKDIFFYSTITLILSFFIYVLF